MCGDCIQVLGDPAFQAKWAGRIDGVITSPPYNLGALNPHDSAANTIYQDQLAPQAYVDWIVSLFSRLEPLVKPGGVVCFNMSYGTYSARYKGLRNEDPGVLPFQVACGVAARTPWTVVDTIAWKKSNAWLINTSKQSLTRVCEFVFVFARKAERASFHTNKPFSHKTRNVAFYKCSTPQGQRFENFVEAKSADKDTKGHKYPCFSTQLVHKLSQLYFAPGATILDPFSGLGTTALACITEDRHAVGIELNPQSHAAAIQRLVRALDASDVD